MADSSNADLATITARLNLSEQQQEELASLYAACKRILAQDAGTTTSMFQDDASDASSRAAILWLLKTLPGPLSRARQDGEAGLPLSEMLNECGSNLVAFFQELPVVLAKLAPYLTSQLQLQVSGSLDTLLKLREWQETLVSLTILAKKYRDLLWRFVQFTGPARQPVLQAGWLTFLLLKGRLLPMFPDLVSCLQLLVAVVDLVVANTPFSAAEVQQLQAQHPAAIDAAGRFNTLKALCSVAKIDYAHVKALMPDVEQQFRQLLEAGQFAWAPPDLLQQQQPLQQGEQEGGGAAPGSAQQLRPQAEVLDVSCALFVPDMLTGKVQLQELVWYLDQTYTTWYQQQGEIDEREFLVTDFGALASPRTRPGAQHLPAAMLPGMTSMAGRPPLPGHPVLHNASNHGSGEGGNGAAAAGGGGGTGGHSSLAGKKLAIGLQSPLPIMHLGPPGPATPVTQTMGSVSWLRSLTRNMPLAPPASLDAVFAAAGPDAKQVLCQQVEKAGLAVFGCGSAAAAAGSGGGSLTSSLELQAAVAKERREEGTKLYWHVLQSMLRTEQARSGLPGARNLLTRWSFHQCLLACSFEMVAASYRMGLLSFPSVPNRLRLKPFDLSKMIGAFVHAEPSLPKELKRHLFTIEEKILESLAWQPGSSIYRMLEAASGDKAAAAAAAAQQAGATPQQQQQQQQQAVATAAADGEGGEECAGREQMEVDEAAEGDMAAMDTDGAPPAAAAPGSGATNSGASRDTRQRQDPAAKRHKGATGAASHRQLQGAAAAPAAQRSLPRAMGGGPGVEPPPGGDPAARAVLQEHCRKVLKLAAFRLVALSEGLDFSPKPRDEVLAAVHEVVSFALFQHTHLFYGRHLDQILLASLYGYCKVHKLQQITFREIIAHYRRQAHAKQEVFRTVVLKQTDPGLITLETGDIIAFYNSVFVTHMKGFLLTGDAATAAASNGQAGSSRGGSSGRGDDSPVPQQQPQQQLLGSGAAGRESPGARHSPVTSAAQALSAATIASKSSPIYQALQAQAAMQQQQQQQQQQLLGSDGSNGSGSRGCVLRGPMQAVQAGSGSVYRALSLDSNGADTAVTSAAGVVVPQWLAAGGEPLAPGEGGAQQQQQQQQQQAAAGASGRTPVAAGGGRAYVPSRLGRGSGGPSPVGGAGEGGAVRQGSPAGVAGLVPGLGGNQGVAGVAAAGQGQSAAAGGGTRVGGDAAPGLQQHRQDQAAGPAAGDTGALPQASRGGAGALKQGEGAGQQPGLAHLLQGLDTAAATDQKSSYVSAGGTAAGAGVAEPAAMVLDV